MKPCPFNLQQTLPSLIVLSPPPVGFRLEIATGAEKKNILSSRLLGGWQPRECAASSFPLDIVWPTGDQCHTELGSDQQGRLPVIALTVARN
jgi:hypothetical protein